MLFIQLVETLTVKCVCELVVFGVGEAEDSSATEHSISVVTGQSDHKRSASKPAPMLVAFLGRGHRPHSLSAASCDLGANSTGIT